MNAVSRDEVRVRAERFNPTRASPGNTRTGPASATPKRSARRDGDRGSASLWLVAIGLLLVAAGLAVAGVGKARVAHHQARVAADLGALAGAARVIEGQAVACDRAARFASANGARLVSCRLDGLDLLVTVAVTVAPLPGVTTVAPASARAGPVRG